MTITITIPDVAFQVLYAYLIVGLLAYVPLNHWAARYISPRRRGLEVWKHANAWFIVSRLVVCAFIWPLFVAIVVGDERKHRRRERARRSQ